MTTDDVTIAADGGCYVPEDPYLCGRCGVDQYDHDDTECGWLPPGTCLDCQGAGCVFCYRIGESRDE